MKIFEAIKQIVIDSAKVAFELYKIMIPILILIRVLSELDLIRYLAVPLTPLMGFLGLPPETGLVLATSAFNSIYAAMVVYVSLLPDMGTLSVAQVSVLGLMMLLAHGLPVEVKVVQKCGVSFWWHFSLRFIMAFVFGLLFHLVLTGFDLLAQPAELIWAMSANESSWLQWAWSQALNLAWIYCVITAVMAVMRILKYLKITDLIIRLLRPFMLLVGIGESAATLTVIGLTMGIGYGGGLIIHEVKQGNISRKDVWAATGFMGLSHGLIEDTLLILLLGASASVVLWGRLGLSLIVMAVLTRLYARWLDKKNGVTGKPLETS